MTKTLTQNDWKKEFQGWAFDHDRRYFKSAEGKRLMGLISRLLAEARREVIDNIQGRLDLAKDEVEMAEEPKDPKVRIKYFEHVLAILRKETK